MKKVGAECYAGFRAHESCIHLTLRGDKMVGAKGFEPSTSWSRTRRASQAALRPESYCILLNSLRVIASICTFCPPLRHFWPPGKIGIGGTVARPPLPHHPTCGSAYGGSVS